MRIDIKRIKVYPFDELSNKAKEKALEELWLVNIDYKWWDSVYEDAKIIGLEITEFELDRGVYCRGKWTEDALDIAQLIFDYHGESCETYKDAKEFIITHNQIKLAFEAKSDYDPEYEEFEDSDECQELYEDFQQAICDDYQIILQKEYDYLISEEAIIETIKANEYEFTADGELYQ